MEPRVAGFGGTRAPLVVWGAESLDTPLSDVYNTPPQGSPHFLTKTLQNDDSNSPKDEISANSLFFNAISHTSNSPKCDLSPKDEFSPKSHYSNAISHTSNSPKCDLSRPVSPKSEILPKVENLADGVKFDSSGLDFEKDSVCSSDDEEDDKKTVYPDGGYGWVIVGCSLVISMVADGISFSLGLMLNEFVDAFGETQAKTAWIGGLFMAVPLLSGPIMSAFVDRYGCRVGTIFGGIISGCGFVIAIFGNSVEYEYMTFGVIAGLGLGLCYVTAVVAVCQWFEKKRSLATGLGCCGTGFGTFVYAPMTQYFIEEFGWRGATLLLSGTFFNMCICGALMRDPEYLIVQKNEKRAESLHTKSIGSSAYLDAQFPGSQEIRNMLKSGQDPEDILTSLAEGIRGGGGGMEEGRGRGCQSVVDIPTHYSVIREEDSTKMSACRSASDQCKLNHAGSLVSSPPRPRKKIIKQYTVDESQGLGGEAFEPLLSGPSEPRPISGILKAKKFFQKQFSFENSAKSNYLKHLRVHRNSLMYRGAVMTTGRYKLKASSCPNIFRNSMTTLAKEQEEKWYTEAVELIKTIFNFSYFLEFHFFLASVGIIILFTFFIVPYFYLTPLMMANGYTAEEGSVVLAYIGLVNAIGMIFFGWVGDQPWVNVAKLFAGCMVVCGISCILAPLLVSNYWLLNLTVWCFALTFASSYSLTPPLIVELIPVEKFTTAYGLILLCQGIGNLVGPSIAGMIFDMTGYWDVSFYLAGGGIMLCGVLIGIIPYTNNFIMVGDGTLEMDQVSH